MLPNFYLSKSKEIIVACQSGYLFHLDDVLFVGHKRTSGLPHSLIFFFFLFWSLKTTIGKFHPNLSIINYDIVYIGQKCVLFAFLIAQKKSQTTLNDHYIYNGGNPSEKWSNHHQSTKSQSQYLDAIKNSRWSLFVSNKPLISQLSSPCFQQWHWRS